MIEVQIVGPCLFVTNQGKLEDVVVPNAFSVAKPRDGTDATHHADGTAARVHYAGVLLLRPNGDVIDRYEGVLNEVMFDDGDGNPPSVDLEAVPPLDEVNNAGGNNKLRLDILPEYTAFTATFLGGEIVPGTKSNRKWAVKDPHGKNHRFKNKRNATLVSAWRTQANQVVVWIDGRNVRTLRNGERAYVYNADARSPSECDLRRVENGTGGTYPDHDYKWLYSLTCPEVSGLSLQHWASLTGGELLAPFTDGEPLVAQRIKPRTPLVSTCFGGTWGGGDG